MFEWQEQYLTSERSERVRYCSCHSNIKSISSRNRVISSIYSTCILFYIDIGYFRIICEYIKGHIIHICHPALVRETGIGPYILFFYKTVSF